MHEVLDVFITDPILIDDDVYSLWLAGHNSNTALQLRVQALQGQESEDRSIQVMLWRDTVDQYRMFEMIEHYLSQPKLLRTQLLFQIPQKAQHHIIEQYYSFDDTVIRNLLGKKLTTKFRKDLDDVTELTAVPLRSCQRQFDNMRRIYSAMEDRNFQGHLSQSLMVDFSLSESLAWRYTCLVFLMHSRFQLHPSKRRTSVLSLRDLEFFAAVMFQLWVRLPTESTKAPSHRHSASGSPTMTAGNTTHTVTAQDIARELEAVSNLSNAELKTRLRRSQLYIGGIDVDPAMSGHLRDIKSHMLNDKAASELLVKSALNHMASEFHMVARTSITRNFYRLLKNLLNIGAGITLSKDLKNFFEDLMHLVGDTLSEMKVTAQEIQYMFRSISKAMESTNGWYLKEKRTRTTYIQDWLVDS